MMPLAAAFRPSGLSPRMVPSTFSQTNRVENDRTSSSPTALFMGKGKGKKKGKGGPPPAGKGFGGAIATDSPIDKFPYAGTVRPGIQSPQRKVILSSEEAKKILPDYALDGRPKKGSNSPLLPWVIEVKKPEEIEKMRVSGKLAREILDLAGRAVKPGITTDEIDTIVHEAILAAGAYPCTLP